MHQFVQKQNKWGKEMYKKYQDILSEAKLRLKGVIAGTCMLLFQTCLT